MFDPKIPYNHLPTLPGIFEYDQKKLLKLAIRASTEVSKLNWLMHLIPNHEILISPLLVKESVESSAIENIHTTTLKVLKSQSLPESSLGWPEKEVLHYHRAILRWYERLKKEWGIGYNAILEIQSLIEPNKPWVRKLPGTVIANSRREVLYTPPAWEDVIISLLSNLERWMHTTDDDIDPFIKMPVMHYQFESIHPFYDGNGRTGRILNVLYLVMTGKLDFPVLFLSEYINKTRQEYYHLFSITRNEGDYTDFIVYLLEGIIVQAKDTTEKIIRIRKLMQETENKIAYLNLDYHKITMILFSRPFLTVSDFADALGLTRQTATKYISLLEEHTILSSQKVGKNKLLFIQSFIDILT